MPLSKHYLDTNEEKITFDVECFGKELSRQCGEIIFALLYGSSKGGIVHPKSDVDLAVYTDTKPTVSLYDRIIQVAEEAAPGVRCDLGFLKGQEPVYCFEALTGKLLFTKDMEKYLRFFSLTCRLYEQQMFHYRKQREYRLKARQKLIAHPLS
ncbi:MAG: nucleotidyltransferase domain-containing protein [Spirochaetota bacterium]